MEELVTGDVAWVVNSGSVVDNVIEIAESVNDTDVLDDDTEVDDSTSVSSLLQSSLTNSSQLQEAMLTSNLSPGGQLYLQRLSPEHR